MVLVIPKVVFAVVLALKAKGSAEEAVVVTAPPNGLCVVPNIELVVGVPKVAAGPPKILLLLSFVNDDGVVVEVGPKTELVVVTAPNAASEKDPELVLPKEGVFDEPPKLGIFGLPNNDPEFAPNPVLLVPNPVLTVVVGGGAPKVLTEVVLVAPKPNAAVVVVPNVAELVEVPKLPALNPPPVVIGALNPFPEVTEVPKPLLTLGEVNEEFVIGFKAVATLVPKPALEVVGVDIPNILLAEVVKGPKPGVVELPKLLPAELVGVPKPPDVVGVPKPLEVVGAPKPTGVAGIPKPPTFVEVPKPLLTGVALAPNPILLGAFEFPNVGLVTNPPVFVLFPIPKAALFVVFILPKVGAVVVLAIPKVGALVVFAMPKDGALAAGFAIPKLGVFVVFTFPKDGGLKELTEVKVVPKLG